MAPIVTREDEHRHISVKLESKQNAESALERVKTCFAEKYGICLEHLYVPSPTQTAVNMMSQPRLSYSWKWNDPHAFQLHYDEGWETHEIEELVTDIQQALA